MTDKEYKSRVMMWFFNHVEIPVINRVLRKGDVHVYSREAIQRPCGVSGMKLESHEVRKGFRLHCVVRK